MKKEEERKRKEEEKKRKEEEKKRKEEEKKRKEEEELKKREEEEQKRKEEERKKKEEEERKREEARTKTEEVVEKKHSAPFGPEVQLREKVIRKNISATNVSDAQAKVSVHVLASMYTCGWKIASVPGLPRFDLPFTFTIIHGIRRLTKIFSPVFCSRVLYECNGR